jgi:hypothetical protein
MHAFEAPEAGTGKSYMIDVASAIATGEISSPPAAMKRRPRNATPPNS